MSSPRRVEPLDPEALIRDLPTTAEDVRALRELRPRIALEDLTDWRWQFGLPQRAGTCKGWKPFEL